MLSHTKPVLKYFCRALLYFGNIVGHVYIITVLLWPQTLALCMASRNGGERILWGFKKFGTWLHFLTFHLEPCLLADDLKTKLIGIIQHAGSNGNNAGNILLFVFAVRMHMVTCHLVPFRYHRRSQLFSHYQKLEANLSRSWQVINYLDHITFCQQIICFLFM